MNESDDATVLTAKFLVPAIISAGASYGVSKLAQRGQGDFDMPTREAENVTKTATALDQPSETARRNRRKTASAITKEFEPPKLSKLGLLGL